MRDGGAEAGQQEQTRGEQGTKLTRIWVILDHFSLKRVIIDHLMVY